MVVTVQGPSTDWVVREKQRQFGFVLNAASARYERVPSYYGVFSTSPLFQIGAGEIARFDLSLLAASLRADDADQVFDAKFVRLMQRAGRFSAADRGVAMLSPGAFSVRVPIASNATNGLYLVRAFVIADGEIVGEATTRFTVRTQGSKRYVAEIARSNLPLYGLATILIALATAGWAACCSGGDPAQLPQTTAFSCRIMVCLRSSNTPIMCWAKRSAAGIRGASRRRRMPRERSGCGMA